MPPSSKPNPEVRDFVNDFLRRPPTIDLPKGGGAIRGIGEKFGANPVTGTASMTVPIRTSPGRSGFGPDLTLSYDSGNGNGPFGFGWLLPLPEVSCKTEKGLPRYEYAVRDSDTFVLGGSEDLVPALVASPSGWVDETSRSSAGRMGPCRRSNVGELAPDRGVAGHGLGRCALSSRGERLAASGQGPGGLPDTMMVADVSLTRFALNL